MSDADMSGTDRFPSYADLHRHLDGSLRLETLRELADEIGLRVPEQLYFYRGMGLQEALDRFATTLAVMQTPAAVRRVAAEVCEDAAREGVTTLELRFAPQLHRGAPLEAIIEAAADGVDGRAGLLLCGLYGEPPSVLEALVEAGRRNPAVVGIDLAGGPQTGDQFGMESYRPAFRRAAEQGLGLTIHAGEGRPADEIRRALEVGATRIGHGTSLLDDPELVEEVIRREIVIEACPTSNVQTGAIARFEDHPLVEWLTLGVCACLNTDNTLFSQVDSRGEHERARQLEGMSDERFRQLVENGHRGAFRR
ncbi:MAG: adenosine deaminase family protein [Myxococcales bacterium]|nr:adenosine deaminase family protein [Myxococcales bacterium]